MICSCPCKWKLEKAVIIPTVALLTETSHGTLKTSFHQVPDVFVLSIFSGQKLNVSQCLFVADELAFVCIKLAISGLNKVSAKMNILFLHFMG